MAEISSFDGLMFSPPLCLYDDGLGVHSRNKVLYCSHTPYTETQ